MTRLRSVIYLRHQKANASIVLPMAVVKGI